MTNPVKTLLRVLRIVEDGILALVLSVMIVMAALQIVLRNFFHTGVDWGDPMLRVAVLWVGMLGAMAATRDDRQISIDALSRFVPARWNAGVRVITDLFTAAVAGFFAYNAGRLVLEDKAAAVVQFAAVPVWVCEIVLPFALGIIAIRYLIYAIHHIRRTAAGEGS